MLQALVLLKSAEEEKERIGEAIERISALEMQGEKVLRLLEAFAEKGSDAGSDGHLLVNKSVVFTTYLILLGSGMV